MIAWFSDRRREFRFRNRGEAGKKLAEELRQYDRDPNAVVLALPRGGVPVGYEIARTLGIPLDVITVRKLGAPGQRELAMGAIASGGVRILNPEVVGPLGVSSEEIVRVVANERAELERRERSYRGERPPLPVRGKAVILVDDGVATGATIRVAIQALRQIEPERIVVAVPVAPSETVARLRVEAEEVVVLSTPSPFVAISLWYESFSQIDDLEVRSMLRRGGGEEGVGGGDPGGSGRS